jgi:hypothetical protein
MLRRRISAWAIVAALVLPVLLGCLMPDAADAHTMPCCAESSCPSDHQQICFTSSAPSSGSPSTPELRAALAAPSPIADAVQPIAQDRAQHLAWADTNDARLHSPPDLYTVHLALLI